MRIVIALATLVATAATVGCSSPPRTREVAIRAFAYSPATDTIRSGDTVVWNNADVVPHTATSREGGFDSKTLGVGETWRWVARSPGTVQYECTLHPTMRGTLVVR